MSDVIHQALLSSMCRCRIAILNFASQSVGPGGRLLVIRATAVERCGVKGFVIVRVNAKLLFIDGKLVPRLVAVYRVLEATVEESVARIASVPSLEFAPLAKTAARNSAVGLEAGPIVAFGGGLAVAVVGT